MKHIQKFEENKINEEVKEFGVVNIHIDGEGWIKQATINAIKDVLRKFQGERHIFVDDEEISPYKRG